jgi:DMSO/TMAO reductase YedYZ molybdopterin-dependent catalytic subunit
VVAGGAGLLWLAVESATRVAALPGARRRFTGSLPVNGADPGRIPVTQWLDDRVQVLDPAAWRLRVEAGDATRDWTYAELEGFGDQAEAVLDCTGGWFARATWEGVRLDRLLPPGATGSVVVSSATGYRRRLPLGDARTLLLATRLAGRPLSAGHGFPARLVARVAAASGGSNGWSRSSSTRHPGGASRRSRSPDGDRVLGGRCSLTGCRGFAG